MTKRNDSQKLSSNTLKLVNSKPREKMDCSVAQALIIKPSRLSPKSYELLGLHIKKCNECTDVLARFDGPRKPLTDKQANVCKTP
ncbi:hypothetical protein K9M79_08120 [Candidatus Woesearchaeota archaeon]|nr:hypothetical protein [Candidatus Woesearchaeota archaeon]